MIRIPAFILLLSTLVLTVCCENKRNDEEQPPDTNSQEAAIINEVNFPSFELIGEIDQVFQMPESIVYDSATRLLFVSNVGKEKSSEADGYISKLNIHGEIIDPKWVEGLSDPRGMCILGNELLVADLNHIIKIAIPSGKIIKRLTAPELKQISDVEKDANGLVYVSDVQSNSIFTLEDDHLKIWKEDKNLENPTGLLIMGNQLLVASGAGNKLMSVDKKSGSIRQMADSLQQARGIAVIGEDLIVGGLSGQLYGVKAGIDFRWPLIDLQMQQDNFADILYIEEYEVLFVPTYSGNSVLAIAVLR